MREFPDRSTRLRLDPGAVGKSIENYPAQFASAWRQGRGFHLPGKFRQPNVVVVVGMGGSHFGADLTRHVWREELRAPLVTISDYTLPGWVNRKSMVLAVSYSGETEETIAALRAAKSRGIPTVVITSGGTLARNARAAHIPLLLFDPRGNLSGQPRLGTPYLWVATAQVLHAAGCLRLPANTHHFTVRAATQSVGRFGRSVPAERNSAKSLALEFFQRTPLILGADWALGNIAILQNQIHENAKTFAAAFALPELNHHLLEGLRNATVNRLLGALVIRSRLYQPRNLRRTAITETILKNAQVKTFRWSPLGQSATEQAVETLVFGSYLSWYLSILRGVDPAPIPTVAKLKAALKRK